MEGLQLDNLVEKSYWNMFKSRSLPHKSSDSRHPYVHVRWNTGSCSLSSAKKLKQVFDFDSNLHHR